MIWSSGVKSRTAAVPTTTSQSIGESPSPGRFAVRFESVSVSPFFIFFAATMLFRATAMFFISEGDGVLMRLPRAESTLRTAFTIAASSAGSSDAAWSGPQGRLVESEMLLYHSRSESRGCHRDFDARRVVAVACRKPESFAESEHRTQVDVGKRRGVFRVAVQ